MTTVPQEVDSRGRALLSLGIPCALVLAVAFVWAWSCRQELRRTAASGILVESRVLPRIREWGAAPRPGALRIALFGDSLLMARDRQEKGEIPSMFVQLGPMIAETLQQRGLRNDVVTVAHFAFRPLQFYYLLDDVLAGKPDVAVVSLNLPVYSSDIRFGEGFGFKNLSRLLSWDQQREIRSVLEEEEITVLDPSVYALQSRIGFLYVVDGVRQLGQDWIQRAAEWIERTFRVRRAPQSRSPAEEARERYALDPDHAMVAMTARLVRDLRAAGVEILVYVAPIDVGRLRRLGVYDELDLPGQIEALRIAIGATPEEFRDFHDVLPRNVFADHRNHLRRAGLRRLAERVAPEIVPRERLGPANVPSPP